MESQNKSLFSTSVKNVSNILLFVVSSEIPTLGNNLAK
ncbi:hypothetical protein LEP1GSC151_0972 [Leptospira interrogans serovar Grippotyphosa str. LT2186]|uniref:Uncharacterized protein n=5 Tax=Leptospira interrogans TaxID=173 RepID=A0A0E2D7U4_LEPIR|nr:hypothetical protein G436_3508 [Leptospira interrogans serovar Hardjo str. Norma]EKO25188.1 hypothetical protein LEP1GSC104_3633 [Leptospira interrogans str. UI 12621]EKO96652.1 hypothetical protein LEP1GSC057_4174 [Leptospira interrogans str. Brem 329]EKR15507.1 hypothetical protein LEP1GSC019_2260 [Leptospira interrogans serovar Pyrogenes str. 2006006960]EKR44566.1 hypothetical protein LEP1GSC097_2612 [Leptospira interrogans serovar Grippotyphosa str. UI 08368]EKR55532.1 hypothetical prot